MGVSVALASYNGEKYIQEQLMSIVYQLDSSDEIIVSDDGSTDNTINIINKLCVQYPNIKLVQGPRKGVVRNFMNAIAHCKHEIIFLSDQDDIWCEGKVECVKKCFEHDNNISVILHNAKLFSGEIKVEQRLLKYKKGFWKNLFKSSYWGCCMAIRKEFAQKYLKCDSDGIAHDQIIGLLAEKDKSSFYIDEDLILHRMHGENKTGKLSFIKKILFRAEVCKNYITYYYKRRK